MHFDVLLVEPLSNGLKSYILMNEQIYFITLKDINNRADFTVYSNNKADEILSNPEIRQKLLSHFLLFLKQNKDEIKLGIYINNRKETFDNFFFLNKIEKKERGTFEVSFKFSSDSYIISNLVFIKNRKQITVNKEQAIFLHKNDNCLCETIKENLNITNFNQCLILIEHKDIIIDWIVKKYLDTQTLKRTNNIIQFPKK